MSTMSVEELKKHIEREDRMIQNLKEALELGLAALVHVHPKAREFFSISTHAHNGQYVGLSCTHCSGVHDINPDRQRNLVEFGGFSRHARSGCPVKRIEEMASAAAPSP